LAVHRYREVKVGLRNSECKEWLDGGGAKDCGLIWRKYGSALSVCVIGGDAENKASVCRYRVS
jgi:hypothetical protein